MENTPSRAVVRASWQGGLPPVSPDGAVPRQLPAVVATFSGRREELSQLDSALSSGAVVISAVNGTAGVGKTALALHWAHRAADRFPDGQLYVNMRGFDPDREPMTVAEAVRGFLDALGVPSDAIPVSLDAQTALFRSKIAGRRVLLVLDNVNNAAQVRPLLPGDSSCFVLITSRNSLAGLVAEHGARPLRLDLLSDDEAAALLRDRLGDVDTDALVELCSGLPLALSIVAARVALEPNTSIAELRAERLEALDLGEEHVNVRSVFSWSLRALSEPAARLFRLLGLHPGPDIDAHAAAALAGRGDCRKLLRELVSASLLEEYLPGRFRFHDLLRLFAQELAGSDDEARHRMLGFYLHTAWAADRALVTQRIGVDLPPLRPSVVPLRFTGPSDAREWFVAEHAVLKGLVGHAAAAGFDRYAWQLALTMRSYLDTQGHWRDFASVYRTAVGPVNRHADLVARVRVHRGLGRALSRLSQWEEAEYVLRLALGLAEESGDRTQQAHCHEALSALCSAQGKHKRALQHANGSQKWHPRHDDAWLASAWVLKPRCYAALNLFDEALVAVATGLKLHRGLATPDETGEAEALNCAAHIYLRKSEFGLSLESATSALTLHRYLCNRPGIVEALFHIGDACEKLGRHDDARLAREEAAAIQADLTGISPEVCS
ncbi:ATP-binding protein [Lentzea sp. NEAU-D7]|uniref:ATP-binding protein n=1 Tax=Lentzea sp. NEAU-D7 TaxID=2994667 RepID=UPI00224B7D6C|nr:tetratricopeptide repeat protein [Lentzea sp. NEAU-D7]MCX2953028.1 NB-ARC domain-containing protein [Lentzea sp. NEAU-D7]